jgi:hypothetical protein
MQSVGPLNRHNAHFLDTARRAPEQAPPMDRSIGAALHRVAHSTFALHAADAPCLLCRWRMRFNCLARAPSTLNSPTACFARTDGQSCCAMGNSPPEVAFRLGEGANQTGTKK